MNVICGRAKRRSKQIRVQIPCESNYWNQLNGCIALGDTAENIGKDFRLDVTNSGDTMDDFHRLLRNESEIKVIIQMKWLKLVGNLLGIGAGAL